jgi:NAD(P)-dependent dehydrogenase (short-subunit alcohol dehydrogenase family)
MPTLTNQVALVTGASRGIGQAIARALSHEGAHVVLLARDRDALESLAAALPNSLAIPTDVTDEAQVQHAFSQLTRLDLLVNNAGISEGAPIDELTLEMWDRVIAANLRGPFLCTREAFRMMKRQGSGRIINVSSIAAKRVRAKTAPYAASKHGLWGLTQVTALEGREFGIACGCLFPGNTLVDRLPHKHEPNMKVEELAQAVVAMASLPSHVNMLEAVVIPVKQLYLGRG